jgi:hypothetical protein
LRFAGLALALGAFAYLCVGLLFWNKAGRVVGKTVVLQIDDDGVSGLPLTGDLTAAGGG